MLTRTLARILDSLALKFFSCGWELGWGLGYANCTCVGLSSFMAILSILLCMLDHLLSTWFILTLLTPPSGGFRGGKGGANAPPFGG